MQLRALAASRPIEFSVLLAFDSSLGGPGMHNVNRGRTGAYAPNDRDVFRPYQYCWMYFRLPEDRLVWLTREIVHMCGLHLEALVGRVARGHKLTLGRGLRNPAVRKALGSEGLERVGRFLAAYNASKHDLSPGSRDVGGTGTDAQLGDGSGGHLFSVEDAVVAYAVCRRLAAPLYHHARLETPRSLWGPFAGRGSFPVSET